MRRKVTASVVRDDLLNLGRKQFKIKRFRPGQQSLIEAVLNGKDALGLLPTGAGKSLTFQLPALLIDKITVVVSPLLALMKDQTEKLDALKISVARLDSSLDTQSYADEIDAISKKARQIVYVTPEQLEKDIVMDALKSAGVGLVVIDEAHCVSQWGHDFRPAYLGLKKVIQSLGRPPIMALTTTATPDIIHDITRVLGMKAPVRVSLGTERPNIFLEVARTVNTQAKLTKILETLNAEDGIGIIYVATVRAADEIYDFLLSFGVNCGRYHARLSKKDRAENQQRFMDNDFKVLVATKAFGMGIDKADIRFVIHYNFPDSLESYYQEIGRSGRDGKRSRALLLYQLEDKRVQSFFLGGKYPTPEESASFYRMLKDLCKKSEGKISMPQLKKASGHADKRIKIFLNQLEGAGVIQKKGTTVTFQKDFANDEDLLVFLSAYQDRHRTDHEKLEEMMNYGQTAKCRTHFIRAYFEEGVTEDKDKCDHCDNCLVPMEEQLSA